MPFVAPFNLNIISPGRRLPFSLFGTRLVYLQQSGQDYVIVERNMGPGSFFERQPRHRRLISLNKRYTGRSDPEFNLRHDWNSLLGMDEQIGRFTNRTTKRWPDADTLVNYLRDFAKPQEVQKKIQPEPSVAYLPVRHDDAEL